MIWFLTGSEKMLRLEQERVSYAFLEKQLKAIGL
jgi:hypothetical protein